MTGKALHDMINAPHIAIAMHYMLLQMPVNTWQNITQPLITGGKTRGSFLIHGARGKFRNFIYSRTLATTAHCPLHRNKFSTLLACLTCTSLEVNKKKFDINSEIGDNENFQGRDGINPYCEPVMPLV